MPRRQFVHPVALYPPIKDHLHEPQARRYQLAHALGSQPEMRDEAEFLLNVRGDAPAALALAQKNFEQQRDFEDVDAPRWPPSAPRCWTTCAPGQSRNAYRWRKCRGQPNELCLPHLACALLLFATTSQAHTLSVSHLDIVVPADGSDLRLELDLALRDVALSLPLDANRDEQVTWGELLAMQSSLQDLVARGLSLSTGAGPCQLTPQGLATRRYDDGGYATLKLSAHCPSAGALQVDYRLLFASDP